MRDNIESKLFCCSIRLVGEESEDQDEFYLETKIFVFENNHPSVTKQK